MLSQSCQRTCPKSQSSHTFTAMPGGAWLEYPIMSVLNGLATCNWASRKTTRPDSARLSAHRSKLEERPQKNAPNSPCPAYGRCRVITNSIIRAISTSLETQENHKLTDGEAGTAEPYWARSLHAAPPARCALSLPAVDRGPPCTAAPEPEGARGPGAAAAS